MGIILRLPYQGKSDQGKKTVRVLELSKIIQAFLLLTMWPSSSQSQLHNRIMWGALKIIPMLGAHPRPIKLESVK